jgi:HPt (histidine-containing phosphotransfer) domain-containing protein
MGNTETKSTPAAQAAIDETAFSVLYETMGDDAPELVEIFFETARDRLQGLRSAVERDDTQAIMQLAHALKGSSAHVGALPLSELCKGLEMQGRSENVKDGAAWLDILEQEYHRVEGELMRRLGTET